MSITRTSAPPAEGSLELPTPTVAGVVSFDPDDVLAHQPLDFALLQSGPISLFWRPAVLEQTVADLAALGYAIVGLDAAPWMGARDLHDAVTAALDFPGYYGRNLAALADCLGDVAAGEYGWSRTARGLAVVIRHFDSLVTREPVTARHVLDIAADCARTGLLFGHRILWLLQVDDPHVPTAPVGATAPQWNPQEWAETRRRTSTPTD